MSKFFTRYAPPASEGMRFTQPSLVEMADFEASKTDNILSRHIPQPRVSPQFGDFTHTPADFGEAYQILTDVQEKFDALPSAVRDRFGNDPQSLLEFLSDDSNRSEAARLGLLKVTPKGGSSEPLAPPSLDGIRPGDRKEEKQDVPKSEALPLSQK
jgi:phage internal scaffolding protein